MGATIVSNTSLQCHKNTLISHFLLLRYSNWPLIGSRHRGVSVFESGFYLRESKHRGAEIKASLAIFSEVGSAFLEGTSSPADDD